MLTHDAVAAPVTNAGRAVTPFSSVELFSGAGGLALGIEQAGFRHHVLVELDTDACDTLELNARLGTVLDRPWRVHRGDVRHFDYSPYVGRTTLLAGGAPCQPFSLGGLQQGEKDPRNLFPEVFRAVRALRPQALLFENVRNLAGRSFRPYFDYIVRQLRFPFELARLDESWMQHDARLVDLESRRSTGDHSLTETFDVRYAVLNAADYGVPQARHRVIIVGFRRDLGITPIIPGGDHTEDALLWSQWVEATYWDEHEIPKASRPAMPASLAARVARLRRNGKPLGKRWRTLRDAFRYPVRLPEPGALGASPYQLHHFIPGARVYEGHTGNALDRPAKTIKAGDHGNPGGEHVLVRGPNDYRYLSIRECARVQTFPDEYHFSGSRTACMRQLGNAVPVDLARRLAASVHAALERRISALVGPPLQGTRVDGSPKGHATYRQVV
jgi:DNA (cytosine-5)-methyltransferase 1